MMKAKDFQNDAADHIVELFKNKHNRVLLADEVGLGKTIVAKTVIEKVKDWLEKEGQSTFLVAYICSNAGIADQNCSKLGIAKNNLIRSSEGRLSMQHLSLYEAKNKSNENLIAMTPATSFEIKNGVGTASERALAYQTLIECSFFAEYSKEFSLLMRTHYIVKTQTWNKTYVETQRNRIDNLVNRTEYIRFMTNQIRANLNADFIKRVENVCKKIRHDIKKLNKKAKLEIVIDWETQREIINCIRLCFAKISLGMLDPDLIVMDEFQKFKDLIEFDENDCSDTALLSKKFLRDNKKSRVLLLSATPYKPYTTLTEVTNGDETHFDGFMRVMKFLENNRIEDVQTEDDSLPGSFESIWDTYTEALSRISSDSLGNFQKSKIEAENKLYQYISRTERRNSGIIDCKKAAPLKVEQLSKQNIISYVDLQTFMMKMRLGGFPVEYVKSAPYLMSFMKYKVKDIIDESIKGKDKDIVSFERDKLIRSISSSFLKKRLINTFKLIPDDTNARLKLLFNDVFSREDTKKRKPELLLWIPPANKYYNAGERSVFEQCEGYSKTLVFSQWEMVPRVISSLTSYEAERLVHNHIKVKSDKQKCYYEISDEDDLQDFDKKRRGGNPKKHFLYKEQIDLVSHPSVWLANKYEFKKYYGQELYSIKKNIKSEIKTDILNVAGRLGMRGQVSGANKLLRFIQQMDKKSVDQFEWVPSEADLDILADMAIGSPAICIYRALCEISDETNRSKLASECCKSVFVRMFNRSDAISIMAAIFQGKQNNKELDHCEQVFSYCVDGNIQSMIDEFKFALGLEGEEFIDAVKETSLRVSPLPYVSQEYYKASFTDKPRKSQPKLRTHFAVGYFDAKSSNDKTVQRLSSVRKAFNSPFRPFVLTTTSVGQEGLDFHLYSRRVVHWNLPQNPIDLEQREGRINRYLCHAIRQNVAANDPAPVWNDKFENTKKKYGADSSDLIPYWCLPENYPYTYKIERVVPMYPYSQDETKYERIIDVLRLYRLTLGQPRQDELLTILESLNLEPEQIEDLCFDLSPYSWKTKGRMLNWD
ncbi:Helicase conserved C-terminal domain-containing protein [Ruminococcaceae bacterium YAD3003]|nr:Helicase conserved C-terminal domain-containing protein [Ruminococcaceae bacterium YAD3003]